MNHFIRLPLKNAYNVRDLGGYACDGGATTCWRSFLRGDDLAQLDVADIDLLLGYGVRTVIDLRSGEESARRPNPFAKVAGVDYVHLPLGLDQVDDITQFVTEEPDLALTRFYEGVLKQRGADLKAVLEAMAGAQDGGVLFHCMIGKDRTGIVAALLLGLAGVAHADIVSNYMVSFQYVRENPFIRQAMAVYAAELFESPPASMEALLACIADNYGSTEAYLQTIGLADSAVAQLRSRLCGA